MPTVPNRVNVTDTDKATFEALAPASDNPSANLIPGQTGLVRYDAMVLAIAACERVDEVKEIRDKARALQAYARQAMNTEAEAQAARVRIRAERRSGELIREHQKQGQLRTVGGNRGNGQKAISDNPILPPRLADLGISANQSSEWQKLADIPEVKFEEALSASSVPSTSGVLRAVELKPQIHMDLDALWAYSRLSDFEVALSRPSGELFALMQDFQQERILELVPRIITWLEELQ